ncbi:hypothetical protein AVEN_118842-1, partial [Araneus ventricosus]
MGRASGFKKVSSDLRRGVPRSDSGELKMFAKLCVLALVLCSSVVASHQVVKYKYFDEYLLHLEKRQQTILVEEVEIKVASPLLIRT